MNYSAFKKKVVNHYKNHGRNLPWKRAITPYKVLVSEIMLQQTQVDRVLPKYKAFMKAFPTFKALSQASKANVLKLWQGLGYNRRALNLKKTAEIVTEKYNGRLPKDKDLLQSLPGIGPYTAGAIRAFAYNEPAVFIETNIRSVYIHSFFEGADSRRSNADQRGKHAPIHDNELFPLIEKTLDTKNPRHWYYALMDYGAYLKTQTKNPSRKSKHHAKQSKFEGSDRQIRGAILRALTQKHRLTLKQLEATIQDPQKRVQKMALALAKEGLIQKKNQHFSLPH